jgi:hypothetical protein
MDTINDWLYMEGAEPARMLEGADLDLAVARGAAYYSYARRGGGVRIRGGTARSYYVGVESSMPAIPGMEPPIQALCVAPFGMEEGSELELPGQEFGLVVGEPVHFRFFGSTTRRQDQIGEVLDFWGPDELQELNEIQATLPAEGRMPGDVVQVRLHALATEAGTLELARWRATASAGRSNSTCAPPTSSKAGVNRETAVTGLPGQHRPRHHQHGAGLRRTRAAQVELFAIDQLVAPGEVAPRRCCPRCATTRPRRTGAGRAAAALAACDVAGACGRRGRPALARLLGAATPGRLVASAKSWLSHPASTAWRPSCPGAPSRRAEGVAGGGQRQLPGPPARAWNARFPHRTRWNSRKSCSPCPPPSTKARAR